MFINRPWLSEPYILGWITNFLLLLPDLHNRKEKISKFRDIVSKLAKPNRSTLHILLKHLLKVSEYSEFNRMLIPNLAIVFGPTLMWPAQESVNMALDLMQQNFVIEALLLDFDSIFERRWRDEFPQIPMCQRKTTNTKDKTRRQEFRVLYLY